MSDHLGPYRLIIAPRAQRGLSETLPSAAAFAAWEFVTGPLVDNPYRVGASLRKPFEGHYRARRGEYRVRYEIKPEARVVRILDIDHRRDIYR